MYWVGTVVKESLHHLRQPEISWKQGSSRWLNTDFANGSNVCVTGSTLVERGTGGRLQGVDMTRSQWSGSASILLFKLRLSTRG